MSTTTVDNEKLVTEAVAAKILSVSKSLLQKQRHTGTGIPYIKLGPKAVRYAVSDLETYIAQHRIQL